MCGERLDSAVYSVVQKVTGVVLKVVNMARPRCVTLLYQRLLVLEKKKYINKGGNGTGYKSIRGGYTLLVSLQASSLRTNASERCWAITEVVVYVTWFSILVLLTSYHNIIDCRRPSTN